MKRIRNGMIPEGGGGGGGGGGGRNTPIACREKLEKSVAHNSFHILSMILKGSKKGGQM